MARILLLKPRPSRRGGYAPTASPPLGLLYLAASARVSRPGKDLFLLVDERVDPHTERDHRRRLDEFAPDVIALSALTTDAGRMADLARWFATASPGSTLVAGGPHVSAYGESVLQDAPLHYAVRGEGEIAFVRLLDALDAGPSTPDSIPVPGLLSRHPDKRLRATSINDEPVDVEGLPAPAWDLVNFSRYACHHRMTPTHKARYAPLFTSRGCPYRCTYCHDVFGKGFRSMSPSKVADEIELLICRYQIHDFEIYDDIFNANKQRVLEICREIKRRKLETRFSFPNGIRGDTLDPEVIRALASVGTQHMAFAIETATPRIQKEIRKHVRLDRLAANIEEAARAGIFCWGFFMVGFPRETRHEVWNTARWAARSRLHGAFFFRVIPFAGTQLHTTLIGDAEGPSTQPSTQRPAGDYHTARSTLARMSPRQLAWLVALAYMRFYTSPSRIARIVRAFPAARILLAVRALGITRRFVLDRPLAKLALPFLTLARVLHPIPQSSERSKETGESR